MSIQKHIKKNSWKIFHINKIIYLCSCGLKKSTTLKNKNYKCLNCSNNKFIDVATFKFKNHTLIVNYFKFTIATNNTKDTLEIDVSYKAPYINGSDGEVCFKSYFVLSISINKNNKNDISLKESQAKLQYYNLKDEIEEILLYKYYLPQYNNKYTNGKINTNWSVRKQIKFIKKNVIKTQEI